MLERGKAFLRSLSGQDEPVADAVGGESQGNEAQRVHMTQQQKQGQLQGSKKYEAATEHGGGTARPPHAPPPGSISQQAASVWKGGEGRKVEEEEEEEEKDEEEDVRGQEEDGKLKPCLFQINLNG